MIRRDVLVGLMALATGLPHVASGSPVTAKGPGRPFDVAALRARAKAMAQAEYQQRPEIPKEWIELSYDDFGHIWFDPRNAVWADTDSALQLDLFTAGLYATRAVQVSVIEDAMARPLDYDIAAFETTDNFPDMPVTPTMGYSGIRLRAELETPGIFTEFFVMQGASYFRAIGTGQNYGLSARGLAIDTAEPSGEEFPDFIAYWIERPGPDAREFTVHALLDSPSVTGVYTFKVRPGPSLEVDVTAEIFPRRDVAHVGIAPLTSMFLFDETNRNRFDDFRPAVHDNNGLLIWNGADEVIWRALANPVTLQVSSFVDTNPKGFGLMQRPRGFDDFADMVARYENRPSAWVIPGSDWGRGSVTLVEIPSDQEVYDNIVVYWRPAEPLAAGSSHQIGYRMIWGDAPGPERKLAAVTNTRLGRALTEGIVVTIDYARADQMPENVADFMAALNISGGKLLAAPSVEINPETGGPRVAFTFDPEKAKAIEFRVSVKTSAGAYGETWLYRWTA